MTTPYEPTWIDLRQDALGVAMGLPKAAVLITRIAKLHRWTVQLTDGRDTGGNYFVTVELARVRPIYHARMTWHTRDTGTLRLFSCIWKYIPIEGFSGFDWQDTTLKKITAAMHANQVPPIVIAACPVKPCQHEARTPETHDMDGRDSIFFAHDRLKEHAAEHHPWADPLWVIGRSEMRIF